MDKETSQLKLLIVEALNGMLVDASVDVVDLDEYESYLTLRGSAEIADVILPLIDPLIVDVSWFGRDSQ